MATESRIVSVKFLGFLQRLAGGREASVEVEASATVADLLASLGATYGPEFVGAVFRAPGEAHTHLRVFLNEEEASMTDCVTRGDAPAARMDLLVLPMVAGGSS